MKKNSRILLVLLAAITMLNACRPDKFDEVGANRRVTDSFAGTWKLTKVTQKDEDAARKGFPYSVLDLTTLFAYTDYSLTLNVTNGGQTTTFSTTAGNSPAVIAVANGDWSAGPTQYPTYVAFKQGSATDTLTLGSYPAGGRNVLQLKKERKDASTGKLLVSYTYEFTKQ
ncbi:DUF5004 domain-containing protein [Nostoc ellipsosporum NOK]|jgi:hypothetical protein|nr:DUF5004 domain-containing protein [Nostoc ellipsosporum NOK]